MHIYLMRHGKTISNEERRYIGRSDEQLSHLGKEQIKRLGTFPEVHYVFVSTLRRTQETARLCFPEARQIVVEGLEELDFGEFEGKTSAELAAHAAYQVWVDTECKGPCPQGEGLQDILKRSATAFCKIVEYAKKSQLDPLVIVAHAGSIMAIMQQFTNEERNCFDWSVAHTEGWLLQIEQETWAEHSSISYFERFERMSL